MARKVIRGTEGIRNQSINASNQFIKTVHVFVEGISNPFGFFFKHHEQPYVHPFFSYNFSSFQVHYFFLLIKNSICV